MQSKQIERLKAHLARKPNDVQARKLYDNLTRPVPRISLSSLNKAPAVRGYYVQPVMLAPRPLFDASRPYAATLTKAEWASHLCELFPSDMPMGQSLQVHAFMMNNNPSYKLAFGA